MAVTLTILQDAPFPIVLMEDDSIINRPTEASIDACLYDDAVQTRFPDLPVKLISAECRGVPIDKLPLVLRYGIDHEPPFAPFNVGGLYKAVEYALNPGLVLFYDETKLEPTFREVAADTPPEDLAVIEQSFPTRLVSSDGKSFWFSRFPAGHRQLQTAYEVHYARWAPGNPLDALTALWVVGHPRARLRDHCLQAISAAKIARDTH